MEKELNTLDRIRVKTPYGVSCYVVSRVTKTEAICVTKDKIEIRFQRKYEVMDETNGRCRLKRVPNYGFNPLVEYYVTPFQI